MANLLTDSTTDKFDLANNIFLFGMGISVSILFLILFIWIGRELYNWHKNILKQRNFIVYWFILAYLVFVIFFSNDLKYATFNGGFFFSVWLVMKAFQRVVRLEPRDSDLAAIKEYIKRKEESDHFIRQHQKENKV